MRETTWQEDLLSEEDFGNSCPECSSTNIHLEEYDFGVDQQTGYHDEGTYFRCYNCGVEGEY